MTRGSSPPPPATAPRDAPRETEIKLALPPAAAGRIGTLPVLRTATRPKPATLRLLSTYFDTEDRRLAHAGIALRVRRSGRRWIQAVKLDDASIGALHRRLEFECPVADSAPSLSAIADAALAERMRRLVGERPLLPLFTVAVERRVWRVAREDAELEVVLDRGEIRAGERSEPVCEIEIETLRGPVAQAFAVAREIAAALPAHPSDASKFARGMALRFPDFEPPAPRRATFAADASPAFALGAAVAECAVQLEREREGMTVAYDSNAVHQMRVALRRLASVRRVLRREVPPPSFVDELRWLRDCLGRSRNWDVAFETVLEPVAAEFPEHRGLAAVVDVAARERSAARGEALDAVRSPRYRILVLDLVEWTAALSASDEVAGADALSGDDARARDDARSGDEAGSGAGADSGHVAVAGEAAASSNAGGRSAVGTIVRRLVRRRWKKLRRDVDQLGSMTAEERHRVRIDAKRLRYAVDTFGALLSKDLVARIDRQTRRLQRMLGAANDVETAHSLVTQLGSQLPVRTPEQAEALGLLQGWCAHAAKTLADRADAAFRSR